MRLKELRDTRNITQNDLGKALNISPSTIGMYEQGRRYPSLDILQKIADYFHVSLDYLLERETKPIEPPKKPLPIVGGIIEMLASLSPNKQEQAKSYIAFLANEDKKA